MVLKVGQVNILEMEEQNFTESERILFIEFGKVTYYFDGLNFDG